MILILTMQKGVKIKVIVILENIKVGKAPLEVVVGVEIMKEAEDDIEGKVDPVRLVRVQKELEVQG